MHPWKIAVSLACCLLLTACGDESAAQKAVKESLKDPESARFGKTTFFKGAKGDTYGCVTVNAKNALGGYVGNKQAIVKKTDGSWTLLGIHDLPHETCVAIAAPKS